MSQSLVRYNEMRISVERCARIDEAAEIKDKAEALQAYAHQVKDRDLEVWTSEIKLRATVRIGELVRELEPAQPTHTGVQLPSGGKLKSEAISDAGLSKSTAHRYEGLAGPRDEQAQNAGKAAAEHYYAKARADREPGTMEGLRAAVKDAVIATLGPPPPRKKPATQQEPAVSPALIDWTAAVKHVATAPIDLTGIASELPIGRTLFLEQARQALPRITAWIHELEKQDAIASAA
jgi:hypothetical protein